MSFSDFIVSLERGLRYGDLLSEPPVSLKVLSESDGLVKLIWYLPRIPEVDEIDLLLDDMLSASSIFSNFSTDWTEQGNSVSVTISFS